MFLTLKEVRESSLASIASQCPSSAEFAQLVNEATRRLMRRGDFVGTVQRIRVCVRRGCVVWPRYVGKVRKINLCSSTHIPTRSQHWEFVEQKGDCGAELELVQDGKTPVMQDILGDLRTIRAYPSAREDVGKTLTIFGVDDGQQSLRTHNLDGTWSEGVQITLSVPYGTTSVFVRRVDRVLKDVTQNEVRCYAYDTVNDVLEDLAIYEPGETNPAYERSRLLANCACGSCGTLMSVTALVKLKFIPAVVGTDLVLIQNLEALKLMCQSIKFAESGDRRNALAYEADAIRELNLELNDDSPLSEIPVTMNPFSGTSIGTQRCF